MEEQQKEGKVRFMSALLNLSFISTNAMWHLYNIFLSAIIFSMYNKHYTPLILENFNKVRFQVSKVWSTVENSIRISMNWSIHRSHITPVTFLQCYFFTFLTSVYWWSYCNAHMYYVASLLLLTMTATYVTKSRSSSSNTGIGVC